MGTFYHRRDETQRLPPPLRKLFRVHQSGGSRFEASSAALIRAEPLEQIASSWSAVSVETVEAPLVRASLSVERAAGPVAAVALLIRVCLRLVRERRASALQDLLLV